MSPGAAELTPDDRGVLGELAPVLRRAVDLDPSALVRFRLGDGSATVFVRLPFRILTSRTVAQPDHSRRSQPLDISVSAQETLTWLADVSADPPRRRDDHWRSGLPPAVGWRRVETVPDDVVRPLVRQGALALKDAARREGVPGAQPRAQVADTLLDSVVLTVSGDAPGAAETAVTLRALSALTRMGFLPRGGQAHIDVSGTWIRVVGRFGTVFLQQPGADLGIAQAR